MNRLDDLKKQNKNKKAQSYEVDIDDEPENSHQKTNTDGIGGTEKGSMEEFFKIVEVVKRNIGIIKDSTKQIVEINQNVVETTTEAQENAASSELQSIIVNGNKNAKQAQVLLKDLNKEVKEYENDKSNENKKSELRIRKNLIQTLTKKYIDVLKEYQDVQNKAKEVKKKRAVKRILTVKPDATPEEIEAVIQTGGATNFARQAILQGDADEVIKNANEAVKSKYQDVLTLEKSVQELAQMFQDFALIVEKQGELLDQIEYQVKSATDYVDQANEENSQAISYLISARKKQCIICTIILIVIAIIAGIVAAKASGKI